MNLNQLKRISQLNLKKCTKLYIVLEEFENTRYKINSIDFSGWTSLENLEIFSGDFNPTCLKIPKKIETVRFWPSLEGKTKTVLSMSNILEFLEINDFEKIQKRWQISQLEWNSYTDVYEFS